MIEPSAAACTIALKLGSSVVTIVTRTRPYDTDKYNRAKSDPSLNPTIYITARLKFVINPPINKINLHLLITTQKS